MDKFNQLNTLVFFLLLTSSIHTVLIVSSPTQTISGSSGTTRMPPTASKSKHALTLCQKKLILDEFIKRKMREGTRREPHLHLGPKKRFACFMCLISRRPGALCVTLKS